MKKYVGKIFSAALCGLLVMSVASCKKTAREEKDPYDGVCACCCEPLPTNITVCFVPLDGIKDSQIAQLTKDFQKKFASQREYETYFYETFNRISTPDSCTNTKYNRFEAPKMISALRAQFEDKAIKKAEKNGKKGEGLIDHYIIGVTDKDISTAIHDKENYGILGLTYMDGNVSVISTYRLKNKKELWKLAAHEFCHGYFNLPHCKNDDKTCILADAKGGDPHFETKEKLCPSCESASYSTHSH